MSARLHAILLDLDGTLIDSRLGIAASCAAALRALGHTPDPAFDVTPHHLIAGIITERGIFRAPYTESLAGAFEHETVRV